MVIDSYCETLAELYGSSIDTVQPCGLNDEQFLAKLNILIGELFSPLTIYTEEDYRSGKTILLLAKKYCFSKRTYGHASPEPAFIEYSRITERMIEDELQRMNKVCNAIPIVDFESSHTIIYNTLQLMSSVVEYHHKAKNDKIKKQKAKVAGVELPIMVDAQKIIHLERSDTKIQNVIPYLDATFGITENFEKARKNPNSPRKIIGEWAEFKYLSMVFEFTRSKMGELELI